MEMGQTATGTVGGAAGAFDVTQPTLVALDLIDESPFNPRTSFERLAELGASLRDRWLVPLIVRPHPKITGRYQLVDGARRRRAAKLAKIEAAPIHLVHMTDQEVMIAQHVSYQREELKELERAESYRRLMTDAGLSAKEIAQRIGGAGMSVETVYARLKLLECIEPVKTALNAGVLTAGHGVLIARLPAGDQARALKACVLENGDGAPEVMSVRELGDWIEYEVRRQKRVAEQRAERKAQPPAKRPASKPAIDWEAKRAKEEVQRKREEAVRRAILDAALEGVKAPLERADLEFVVAALVDDRGADDWKEAVKAIPAMKPQQLGHLLIEQVLADDLEYEYRKPDRLLAFAKRHKVNVDRIRARVEKEWETAKATAKAAAPAQTSAKPATAKAGAK